MKTNAIIRIIIWSIVITVLLGLLTTVLAGRSLSRTQETAETYSIEAPMNILPSEETITFSPDEITELEIEWVSGSILIQPADVEMITVSESDVADAKDAMLYKQKGKKLTILFSEEGSFSGLGITINTDIRKDLTIFVPRDWECGSLEIDAASATVEINDLTIREVEFDGASGACELENCTVDTIDMDTASGDVNFSGALNILDFDGASASIFAVLTNTPTRMDIDTMSGDLDITLPEDTGFAVNIDSLSGTFFTDFETTVHNGNHIHGDGRCRIDVSAMSGDLKIHRADSHHHDDSCYAADSTCPDKKQH